MTEHSVPESLIAALGVLWRVPPPGPENLFSFRPFTELCSTCERLYPPVESKDALGIALHTALTALGLPYTLSGEQRDCELSVIEAAIRLDHAFRKTHSHRTHLCPLDCADDLPVLTFGTAVVRNFSASELEEVFDAQRLQRSYPSWTFDAESFASFTWLVVKEEVALDREAGKRAVPFFYSTIDRDFGAIEPHRRHFPAAVESALFALLLAPWEDWVEDIEIDWRAFRIPWVYTADDDLFPARPTPPSPKTLSWEPCIYTDEYGHPIDGERPIHLPLSDRVKTASASINHECWAVLEKARQAAIFGSPIEHFLNRAFVSNGIDEFLAHMTVIEAGLGTGTDYIRRKRKFKSEALGATTRVAARLARLLEEARSGEDYQRLFQYRSDYIHGRALKVIPSADRALARALARRTATALVAVAADKPAAARESFLESLLLP